MRRTLFERLNGGETVFAAWSGVPDALVSEMLARTAFNAVALDMQHGGHHEDSVLRGLQPILAAGKPALVRIPIGRFDMAGRALDFGAEAVIAPMVNSVEDARRLAAATKYPPVGERSWGPTFAMSRAGTTDVQAWFESGNSRTLALAMIETRRALAALDDILAVDGIDGVLVGPSDFSIAWSEGKTVDPQLDSMMDAVADIAARARQAGKHAAIYSADPGLAGRFIEMGFRLIAMGGEQCYLSLGVDAMLARARASVN